MIEVDDGVYTGDTAPTACPRCQSTRIVTYRECFFGCCDDYCCEQCDFTFRFEWPDRLLLKGPRH
jgi:hypothetical protein